MVEGKLAQVIAFSKEQGFGRVRVEDEGEFVFDASVAQCSTDDLTVGADVFVCTGPGRVAGQQKVNRLWRDAAPSVQPSADEGERFESFGPYSFLLPPFWPRDTVNDRAPIAVSAARLNDVSCMLLTYVGGALEMKAKPSLIAERSTNARTTRCDQQVLGLSFEGYRFEGGSEVTTLYILATHGDLLAAETIHAAGNEQEAEHLSLLLLTIIGAAVHRRGPPTPSSAPKGFWKRLFG
jgi:hypothetical protein